MSSTVNDCCFLCSAILTCACKSIANELGSKYAAQNSLYALEITSIAILILEKSFRKFHFHFYCPFSDLFILIK